MKIQGGYSAEPGDGKRPAAPTTGSGVSAPLATRINRDLLNALEPFAVLAHDHDFAERADDDVVEVPFKHLKQAWLAFAKVAGADNA